jgi:intermembrane space import and assembly protein 40
VYLSTHRLSRNIRPSPFQRSFRQHVQISTAARIARSPSQCDCFEAIIDHRATSQDVQELEELGREMDTGRWSHLLLQHFKRFRRGAHLYVYHDNAHKSTCRAQLTNPSTDAIHSPPETSRETETYPTVDSIAEKRRAQARSQEAQAPSSSASNTNASVAAAPELEGAAPGGPKELEQEAGQQGAFNEETGEINWDCPCLGGMAHGPCGEQFREAFSCFVFSKDEPKGIDCIDKFKGMQDCFREHPDIYGAELEDDEEGVEAPAQEGQAISSPEHPAGSPHDGGEKVSKPYGRDSDEVVAGKTERASRAAEQVKRDSEPVSESETMVPKAWHSGVDANTEK